MFFLAVGAPINLAAMLGDITLGFRLKFPGACGATSSKI